MAEVAVEEPITEAVTSEEEAPAEGEAKNAVTEELEPVPEGIAINFEIKHPLQRCWTMWYDNPGPAGERFRIFERVA